MEISTQAMWAGAAVLAISLGCGPPPAPLTPASASQPAEEVAPPTPSTPRAAPSPRRADEQVAPADHRAAHEAALAELRVDEGPTFVLDSEPGIAVVYEIDGPLLGTTPLTLPRGYLPLRVTVRRYGYREREVTLDTSTGERPRVALVPVPTPRRRRVATAPEVAVTAPSSGVGLFFECPQSRGPCSIQPGVIGARARVVETQLGRPHAVEGNVWIYRYEPRCAYDITELRLTMSDGRVGGAHAEQQFNPNQCDEWWPQRSR